MLSRLAIEVVHVIQNVLYSEPLSRRRNT
jgi:hypothetical protein